MLAHIYCRLDLSDSLIGTVAMNPHDSLVPQEQCVEYVQSHIGKVEYAWLRD